MLAFLISIAIVGLIVGFLARAIVPGADPMGIGGTILLGIMGSIVGGFLADLLFRSDTQDRGVGGVGLIGATIGGVICLLVYRAATGRSGATRYR
jgi:uncharacterized membrane protein YeaQ/YmgE (transglycosylase-associated protein family)